MSSSFIRNWRINTQFWKKSSRICYHQVDWASERLSDPWNLGPQARGSLRNWRLEMPPGLANKQKEQTWLKNLSTKAWCDAALLFLSLFPPSSQLVSSLSLSVWNIWRFHSTLCSSIPPNSSQAVTRAQEGFYRHLGCSPSSQLLPVILQVVSQSTSLTVIILHG